MVVTFPEYSKTAIRDGKPASTGVPADSTILLVGPTGSGKTALMNALLGFNLFPEGSDHTTLVPCILRQGPSFDVRVLGSCGTPLSSFPTLRLAESLLVRRLPNFPGCVLKRLRRPGDLHTRSLLWREFWKPVHTAATTGERFTVETTAPLKWLRKGVSIVDLPGYEGWLPEDSPDLHGLAESWLSQADHAVFVTEKSRIFLAKATQFLRHRMVSGKGATLLVNQMDTFDPYQFSHDGFSSSSCWDRFAERLQGRLLEEGIHADQGLRIFMGACRVRGEGIQPAWLEDRILSDMFLFFHRIGTLPKKLARSYVRRTSPHRRL